MKQHTKHTSQEAQQLSGEAKHQQSSAREFATPEELLQHDAARTFVPPAVEARLAQSLRSEPKLERSWWRRVFGR